MAWERRKHGGLYYTRSRRVNGRVVREYIGCGLHAELAAVLDAQRRAERQRMRVQKLAELEHFDRVGDELAELNRIAERLAAMGLVAGGYHKHKGEWRYKCGQGTAGASRKG